MNRITVPSPLLTPTSDKPLTPAMVTTLWVIGDELDRRRISSSINEPVTLDIKSAKLRGEEGRNDNVWLRECLTRLTGLKIGGEYRGDPWGAVVVAQWEIIQGGSVTRVMIPPMAVRAIRAPENFAKIESLAAYKLQGAARRLYAALADKKRLKHQNHWTYSLDELRDILGVSGKKSYERWNNFRQWVLQPALESVNDFGTVKVTMTPQRVGRAINAVRFDWDWKTIDEARVTEEENERLSSDRHKQQTSQDMPPLSDDIDDFEHDQSEEERAEAADRILKDYGFKN